MMAELRFAGAKWGVILVSDGTNIPNKQGLKACYNVSEDAMISWDQNKERN